jgi:amidophosphoribosyltransferase
MLREAGAREVHVRISSPPVKWPCFYGIDFASRAELIATGLAVEEIRQSIGADSLAYVSLEELVEASTVPAERLCTACFTGQYPIEIAEPDVLGRPALAAISRAAAQPELGGQLPLVPPLLVAAGAADALKRP